jgi:hypothetical protein
MQHLKEKLIDEKKSGSFYNDTIIASILQLTSILGESDDIVSGDNKISTQWTRKTSKGGVFWVYDYKYYRVLNNNETIRWNIGAENGSTSHLAKEEIENCLKQNLL